MTAKFKVGDLVDMRPPSGHGRWIRGTVTGLGAKRLTVRLADGRKVSRPYTATERSSGFLPRSYTADNFRAVTAHDLWRERRPEPGTFGGPTYRGHVEITDEAIRDHTDAVIAYVTARAAWLREEPPRE